MPQALFRPFEITFEGHDADEHVVDAVYLGESLSGTGRVYNSVVHLFFHGRLQKRPVDLIRMLAGPPRDGSLTYLIWAMMTHGNLPMHPALLGEMADIIIPEFVKAIFSKKAGRKGEMEKALDACGGR